MGFLKGRGKTSKSEVQEQGPVEPELEPIDPIGTEEEVETVEEPALEGGKVLESEEMQKVIPSEPEYGTNDPEEGVPIINGDYKALIAQFEKECLGKRHTISSVLELAVRTFGDVLSQNQIQMNFGLNNREVYFEIGGVRVPEVGIFPVGS